MENLYKIVSNIMDGIAHGFYNTSCQPGIKIQCQSNVNFWLDESKDVTLKDAQKYVKDFNAKSNRHMYLDVNMVNGQLMFSFSFNIDCLNDNGE